MSDYAQLTHRLGEARRVLFPAEQNFLGALMVRSSAWDEATPLDEADFSDELHGKIYRAIRTLKTEGKESDIISVAELLERWGDNELPYLGQLASATVGHVVPSLNTIKRYNMLKRVVGFAHEAIAIAVQQDDPFTLAEHIQQAAIQLTETAHVDEFRHVSDTVMTALQDLDRRYHSGNALAGLSTGFPGYDSRTGGIKPAEVTVIAGASGMGKTTFAYNIAEHVALSGKTVLTISLEMSDVQLGLRHLASIGGVGLPEMQSADVPENSWSGLTVATAKLRESRMYTVNASSLTPARLASLARACKRKHGLDLLVIDYLQLMSSEKRNASDYERTSDCSRAVKLLAKELNIPILLLAQVNRSALTGADKRPQMYHLRDSGGIEQDADVVTMLYRDCVYNPQTQMRNVAEIITRKCRMGEPGTDYADFEGRYSRFKAKPAEWVPEETVELKVVNDGRTIKSGKFGR